MPNPAQRDLLVEVAFGADLTADPDTWSWTDVSADLLAQDISITRGRSDESSETQPMACSLQLDNVAGDYTPGNPTGAHYPMVRRGTPLRLGVAGQTYFEIGYPQAATITTPSAAALDLTSDIDIRADIETHVLDGANSTEIASRFVSTGNQRSWVFTLGPNNQDLALFWSADGTSPLLAVNSTEPPPVLGTRLALRATLDVNNGAGGRTATFYTAPSIDGPWTQLGDPVVQAGTTSIFNSTAPMVIGNQTAFPTVTGRLWAAQLYDGIDGTLVADADLRELDPATTAFTDSVGREWTLGNGAVLDDLEVRFVGQVDSWEPTWPAGDVTGEQPPDARVDIAASSVRRRMSQGQSPLDSAIRRGLTATTIPIAAYWPMEDGVNSTSIASGFSGAPGMTISGAPRLAASDIFAASGPLPEAGAGSFSGAVPAYTPTGVTRAQTLLAVPSDGDTDGAIIMRIFTTGTAARWDLRYDAAGSGGLTLLAYDSSGANILNSGAVFAVDGKVLAAFVELTQDGSDVDWVLVTVSVTTFGGLVIGGTLAGRTAGQATRLDLNPGGLFEDTVLGHAFVSAAAAGDVEAAIRGYIGESAADRFERLCTEENVGYRVYGTGADTEQMGPQIAATLLELLQQCADSDAGILLDTRDTPGLLFRPRTTLYRQDPDLTLNAAVNGIANPFAPVLDDQRIRNDITVTRQGGSSTRAVDQASVDDEGRYDDAVELSLFTDDQTVGQAWWRLHLGTVDGMRYATVTVDFDTAPADILTTWLTAGIDVGDLIRVRNLPRQHPPGDVDLLIQGYTETISPSRWRVTFNCSPASPYEVMVLDDPDYGRLDSESTTLDEDLDTTETGVDYAGDDWITTSSHPSEFPFDVVIGGEVMTVTAATASTFTVTRSVNGVVKAHSSGAPIRLADPVYIAL